MSEYGGNVKKKRIVRTIVSVSISVSIWSAALLSTSYAADIAYKFEISDMPLHVAVGAQRRDILRLTDIDGKGRTAGNDSMGRGYFVGTRGKAHKIRCPSDQTDNESTAVSAINNLGQVVGSCTDGGFVRDRNGHMTILNFPGADGTIALGINDAGDVVGQYWGNDFGQGLQRFHGFVWRNGEYATIDASFPEAMATILSGINNAGQIIGTYLHHRPGSSDINDYDGEIAFFYDNGNFTELNFPDAHIPFCCGAQTFPMDINNVGQVVGSTYSSEGNLQFFLLNDGNFFKITGLPKNVVSVEGSWGLNDKGHIAGTYVQQLPCDTCGFEGEAGYKLKSHSFIAKPQRPSKKHLVN